MFIEKFQYALLYLFSTTMRHVPQFGFKFFVSILAFPGVVHRLEGFLYA